MDTAVVMLVLVVMTMAEIVVQRRSEDVRSVKSPKLRSDAH